MKSGDVVLISYTARIKETGEVFDTTSEEVAKKAGIFDPKIVYQPIPVIIGSRSILPGVEEIILGMKVGEEKKFTLPPEKAFGKRLESLVRLIPLSEFKKQNIEPYPGLVITINNFNGRVVSVSGGRVKVDFNHPLAGKEIEYELKVEKKIETVEEKIKIISSYHLGLRNEDLGVKVSGKTAEIEIKKRIETSARVKQSIAEMLKQWIKGIEKVKFVEVF